MLDQLLPQRIDSAYRGSKFAPWLLALIVGMKMLQSLLSIFAGHYVAGSADGIPVDTYTPAGAQTVVALFALLGFTRLMIYLICVAVMVRYRSAIPFMFVLLVLEHLGRTLILQFVPIARTGTPIGPVVNLVLLALMIIGLALSLRSQPNRQASPAG
jgi:hypothetical protein